MFTALTKVYDLSADIIASVALFEQLVAANEGLMEHLNSEAAVNTQAIAEARALNATIESGVENHTITDAEAKEYMEKIDVLYTKVVLPNNINEASDNNPVDVTAAIKSPSFEDEWGMNSSTGWTNPGNLGNDDEQKSALAIEFWQIAFDMFQTIKGLPEGTYELTVDAWCRNGSNEENYAEWQADSTSTMALLYGVSGDSTVYTSYIANIMIAGDALLESTGYPGEAEFTTGDVTYWLPGSLVSGKGIIEMNSGVYTNSVIVKVGADEKLTIGIKKGQEKTNSWVVCDDFKLYYLGKNSAKQPGSDLTGIEDVNAQSIMVEFFTLDGRKVTNAQKGIVIKKITLDNGATLIQKIRK